MSYEIDFVGVKADKCTKDADAICLRWKVGEKLMGRQFTKLGLWMEALKHMETKWLRI